MRYLTPLVDVIGAFSAYLNATMIERRREASCNDCAIAWSSLPRSDLFSHFCFLDGET